MKRYKINSNLISKIKSYGVSLDKISEFLGFQIKHILYDNLTISEFALNKINSLLNSQIHLKEAPMNYEKNLGKYSFTTPN